MREALHGFERRRDMVGSVFPNYDSECCAENRLKLGKVEIGETY